MSSGDGDNLINWLVAEVARRQMLRIPPIETLHITRKQADDIKRITELYTPGAHGDLCKLYGVPVEIIEDDDII